MTTATPKAVIVPLGLPTTCTFQFVGSADFLANGYDNATSVPCMPASLGAGFGFQQATADLSGLTLGAFYHFRAIATNSAGTATGADQTSRWDRVSGRRTSAARSTIRRCSPPTE